MKSKLILVTIFFFVSYNITAQKFTVIYPEQSGIHFFNKFVAYRNIIEGNGVGVGDFDNDNWQDIFFVSDGKFALYRNLKNLKFENLIEQSGISHETGVSSVTIYDINNDGLDDIIIGFQEIYKKNEEAVLIRIYLNIGDFRFKEVNEAEWKINTTGSVSRINLIDFNKDHFADLIINHWNVGNPSGYANVLMLNDFESVPGKKYKTDQFIFNNKTAFWDATRTVNMLQKTPVHMSFNSISTDVNNDGWVDIIMGNDFDCPNYVFENNSGVKFEDVSSKYFKVSSMYSMGSDAADINNDGFIDFLELDMRPLGNKRSKTFKYEQSYTWNELEKGKNPFLDGQYVRNSLHLNNGNLIGNWSEIGQFAGIDATDWSWTPLIADFDNDGWKDIFISNGMKYGLLFDVDAALIVDSITRLYGADKFNEIINSDSSVPEYFRNYIFKNNKDLTFKNMQIEWGFEKPFDSRGAAYADFDNDGDLDIVVNNLNQESIIYRNDLNNESGNNFLRIKLINENHLPTINSKVTIYSRGNMQLSELNPLRGFYSTSENILHFGLDTFKIVDSLTVIWSDGKIEKLKNIGANKTLLLFYSNAKIQIEEKKKDDKPLFSEFNKIEWKHIENDFTDYSINPLLPNQYSKLGPAVACGDLNGDKKFDIITGGAHNQPTSVFLQQNDGSFLQKKFSPEDSIYEDMGILIFDIDNDGDNDIYIASGGYEFTDGSDLLQHRLYINNRGQFIKSNSLPEIKVSASCVTACDFDKDGYMDLLVGGRIKSHHYPFAPQSFLLKNEKGKFIDVTDSVAPELKNIGMVTSSIWTDYDNDGWFDLIVVGEYMQPEFFQNNGKGQLKRITSQLSFGQKLSGFWNSISGADIDNDGDIDYILGNLGLNTRWKANQNDPLELFAADFDDNGSIDIITTYRENGNSYPTKQLNSYKERISGLSKKFYKAEFFSNATIYDMFSDEQFADVMHLSVFEIASGILINGGNGVFRFVKLPSEAQLSPVFGIYAEDFDGDNNIDLLLTGNFHGAEIERGKYTALNGLLLKGDGLGNFKANAEIKNQFVVTGDAKSLALMPDAKGNVIVLATQNNDSVRVFQFNYDKNDLQLKYLTDNTENVRLFDGKFRKYEKYTGSGYLSQSVPFYLFKK
jgi:enediyne biosynthesis protein E4